MHLLLLNERNTIYERLSICWVARNVQVDTEVADNRSLEKAPLLRTFREESAVDAGLESCLL